MPPSSSELRDHSRILGYVPLIDHNPRGGEKIEFAPAEAIRYNEGTAAERSNARLKDEFGGNTFMVKGGTKVMGHLMFGIPGAVRRSVDALATMTPCNPISGTGASDDAGRASR